MSERRIGFSRQFTRDYKRLQKHYPRIGDDLRDLMDQLKSGKTPGDQMQGVGRTVYKVRVRNRSAASGKRGGFRVLYYIQSVTATHLFAIFSKSKRDDISANEIRRLLDEVDAEHPPDPS